MKNLAVDSIALGDRVMVITDGQTKIRRGATYMTGTVTATRSEDTEAAIGSEIEFLVTEIFG